ncbi:hypothetical protein [Microbacterium oxydans]|uniref:hypothetical protein n=1 Tax=Microbacterium oxydans TaxID=82380 RepID=UPI00226B420A|nr:hypothetical protein [Microbacterium oxydans]WAA65641.1 hypothetical protein MME74_15620 [Microbacterium oxydans]
MLVGDLIYYFSAFPDNHKAHWFNSFGELSNSSTNLTRGDKVAFPQLGETGKVYILDGLFAGQCLGAKFRSGTPDEPTIAPVDCAVAPDISVGSDGVISDAGTGRFLGDWAWYEPGTDPTRFHGRLSLSYYTVQPVTIPGAVVPVDITGPVDGEVSDTRNPTITGTGDEGAEVILTDDAGTELCRATVSSGAWSCTVGVNLPDGPIKITATQTATDGTTTTDNVSIIIADPLNSPVIDPTLAGGAGIALFAIAGTVIAIRNRKKTTAA